MLFNSLIFFIFLPIVFALYWFVFQRNLRAQNLFLIAAGWVFYGWWDWRYLFLLAFSIVLDYTVGILIHGTEKESQRKLYLAVALVLNLGLLGFFKYYNFFVSSLVDAFAGLGFSLNLQTLEIILPVGISFYTFQSLSYSLDIFKRRIAPCRDFISYAAFVSFFPQLVAGPIERAAHLLPQMTKARTFDYAQAANGMRLILWGLFKKVVIADNLAPYVQQAFGGHESHGSITLLLGAVYFTVQIYCDFSGYSDIAIGVAKLIGFELMSNFRFPFFARSIPEFWSRWHISLTTWFNDYIYTPTSLNLRDYRKWGIAAGILLTFFVSGVWHGANWTFVIWGILNGLLFMPYVYRGKMMPRRDVVAKGKWLPTPRELGQMAAVFLLWSLVLVFFRAPDVGTAFAYLGGVFSRPLGAVSLLTGLGYVALVLMLDWINRENERDPRVLKISSPVLKLSLETAMAVLIFVNLLKGYQSFVYFQF